MIDNQLRNCRYLLSAHKPEQWPQDKGNEVAFVGRSNVGKSSAINRLTDQKSLARISKTPGRTQQIIFFSVTDHQRLVDLPGYGYAKVPLAIKDQWKQHIETYFAERRSLKGLVLPIDIRHELTPLDQQMLQYCMVRGLSTLILLTKADKLTRNHANQALFKLQKQLDKPDWATLTCELLLFSAHDGQGQEQAREIVCNWLEL